LAYDAQLDARTGRSDVSLAHVAPVSVDRWVPNTMLDPDATSGPVRSTPAENAVRTSGITAYAFAALKPTVPSARTTPRHRMKEALAAIGQFFAARRSRCAVPTVESPLEVSAE
jgi:hypothetical protein